jgi:hypothetical protein
MAKARRRYGETMRLQPLADVTWGGIRAQRDAYAMSDDETRDAVAGDVLARIGREPQADLRDWALLAELYAASPGSFHRLRFAEMFADGSADGIEGPPALTSLLAAMECLEYQSGDPMARYLLHRLLDCIKSVIEAIQSQELQHAVEELPFPYECFTRSLRGLADTQSKTATKYLIRRKFRDIAEMFRQDVLDKPGALHGVAGASSDEMIYAFQNMLRNYELRTQHRYYEGDANVSPLLPLSEGLVARYGNGLACWVMVAPDGPLEPDPLVGRLIKDNDPSDEAEIYPYLARPDEELIAELKIATGRRHDPKTVGLNKLKGLWEFKAKLQAAGRRFLFDFGRIDVSKLHPFVLGELVKWNNGLLHEASNGESPLRFLSREDLLRRVFPGGGVTAEGAYRWDMLSSLSVRKKVEDDFGIDVSEYPMWIQRLLFEYLDGVDADEVARIKPFLETGDRRARLITLVAAPAEQRAFIQCVVLLPGGEDIVRAYAEIAENAEHAAQDLAEQYRRVRPDTSYDRQHFVAHLLSATNRRLREAAQQVQKLTLRADAIETQTAIATGAKLIRHEDGDVQWMRNLIAALSRDEVAALDIDKFASVRLVGPLTGAQLRLRHADVYRTMLAFVERNFPGYVEYFERIYLRDDRTRLIFSQSGSELLAFFGVTRMTGGRHLIDFMNANLDRPIPGLPIYATVRCALDKMAGESPNGFHSRAKPHVALSHSIESAGGVAFGRSDEEEEERYARIRVRAEDHDSYVSKTFSPADIGLIRDVCDAVLASGGDGAPVVVELRGEKWEAELLPSAAPVDSIEAADDACVVLLRRGDGKQQLRVVHVAFDAGKNHEHDIRETDGEEGRCIRLLDRYGADNAWVLTRFVPESQIPGKKQEPGKPGHQSFLCVFEPSAMSDDGYEVLQEGIRELIRRDEEFKASGKVS